MLLTLIFVSVVVLVTVAMADHENAESWTTVEVDPPLIL